MEQRNHAVATHFAEYLVGSMLQRSGADFLHIQSAQGKAVDFLVRDGDRHIAIQVKHAADSKNVSDIWKAWLSGSVDATPGANDDFHSIHLVIVTGAGEIVFTDAATARFLRTDSRTSLAMLTPPAETAKHTAISSAK
jgi:hypothetical protein